MKAYVRVNLINSRTMRLLLNKTGQDSEHLQELTRVYVEQSPLKHDEVFENTNTVCGDAIIKGTLQQNLKGV